MDLISTFYRLRFLQDCRNRWLLFALCSAVGSLIGVMIAISAGNHYFLLMHMATGNHMSIVDTGLAIMLPFWVSLFLIVHSKPWLVYVICLLQIAQYSAALYAIAISFGSAGWIVNVFLQFSDVIFIPILLLFSIFRMQNRVSKRLIYIYIAVSVAVGLIDCCLISPYLANLIENFETMGRYAIHAGLDRCL